MDNVDWRLKIPFLRFCVSLYISKCYMSFPFTSNQSINTTGKAFVRRNEEEEQALVVEIFPFIAMLCWKKAFWFSVTSTQWKVMILKTILAYVYYKMRIKITLVQIFSIALLKCRFEILHLAMWESGTALLQLLLQLHS